MNARAKKSRSSSARGGRGKGIERQLSANGVYNNHRFMQTVGALVGLPVQVLTKTKEMFEGVLTTFGPNFEIVLDWPHTVAGCLPETSVICNADGIKRKMIFDVCDIVQIRVTNVNMEYASKDSFAVDSQISKFNGRVLEKELEPWQGDSASHGELGEGLEENANGWDADDMFKKNEEKYGVQTTYDPDMEGYTTPLQKKNTKEYKEQEAKAHKIALEIEHSPATQTRAQLENGEDEEEKYSAVTRPEQSPSDGSGPRKYMPPQRRKIPVVNNKPPPRGTPSPQSSVGGSNHMSGSRYNNHSSPTTSYVAPQQSSPISPSSMGPPTSSSTSYASQAKHQKVSQQQSSVDSKLNGDNKDSRRHEYARDNKDNYQQKENYSQSKENYSQSKENYSQSKENYSQSKENYSQSKENYSQSKENYSQSKENNSQSRDSYSQCKDTFPQNKESYSHAKENYSHPKENYPQDMSHGQHHHHHSQSFSHTQSYHSSNDSRRSEPREQREPRKSRNQKEEQLAELRKFGQDFTLTESTDKKATQHPILHQQTSQIPPQQQSQQYQANQHSQSSQQPAHQQNQQSQLLQTPIQQSSNQQQNIHSQNQQQTIQPSSSSNVAPKHMHPVTTASQVPTQPPPPPPPTHLALAQVPPLSHPVPLNESRQTNSPHALPPPPTLESKEDDKASSSISSSKLNPNAKEFVFNPNAKPFSPRSPNTTTPPRTQTPQIPPTQPPQMGAGGVPSISFPQNMIPTYVMAQHYQMQQQPRYPKRVQVGNQRQDYASSMQVAAATGHPILAPAPLTPITAPQAISAVQIPQNMMGQAAQHYQYQGMPMMVRFPGPGIPMVTTMVPTSMGMYHQMEAHQTTHSHQHLYMGPNPGGVAHQQHQPHPSVTPGPHPGQPPTPQGHNNAGGPNQLSNLPPQPPTPGPTPPQTMIYGGPAGAQMGGQPTITQHIPHSAQSPHNQYPGSHNAALAAATASHHAPTPQLVMIPPHMTHHMMTQGGPPHSATGHIPSSIAGYTPTSSGAMQHMNHGAQYHYIPAGVPPCGQGHLPIVQHNQ